GHHLRLHPARLGRLAGHRQVKAQIPAALEGERVDRAVALLCDVTRSDAAALVAGGAVRLDGTAVPVRSRRVTEGQWLEVTLPPPDGGPPLAPDPAVDVPVVFADGAVIVVDKPPGLVVHPGAGHDHGTMVQGLLARFPDLAGIGEDEDRPGIVHRLDAGTSGLLVVARTADAYRSLVAQLAARTVERRYLALVWGHVEAEAGLVDAPIGRATRDPTKMTVAAEGRPARTRYEVLGRFTRPVEVTLVECRLETGRTHQIRVHLAAIGHPVVGDGRYRGERSSFPSGRPFLHAHRLAFDHPVDGQRRSFESPLPPDLEAMRDVLD
ncbi:MAG: RluA family pseudouridine synthase, partial [Acidimicrobiales bacterium]